jgi:peptidoglycan/LPS O-acetylase OafA/YrhL
LKYRSDIDGLRAIAVMSVIAFHSGISVFSGGYVGVDIFFVISGYLITTQIYKEITEGTFTFKGFYKRRAARLLPALSLTLCVVLVFGFIYYNNKTFDNLGKELLFSSLGAANILFSQGVNYFANDEAYQPLIHLWSLGVEEQFYLVWPIILLFFFRISNRLLIPVTVLMFIVSLGLSVFAVKEQLTKGYFLPHYRAFELLVGVITALYLRSKSEIVLSSLIRQIFTYIGIVLIIAPMLVLTKESSFPGYNALWPCLGAALIISFPNNGLITNALSNKMLVFIGLISYPLYLFHQPLISFIYFFDINFTAVEMFFVVVSISTFASWFVYNYIEKPVRRMAHAAPRKNTIITISGLVATIPIFAISGLVIAKSGGLEYRFKYLNPFALEITQAHSSTFNKNFERGVQVSAGDRGKALFVGDSVLQHYVLPMSKALDLEVENIDSVTRGGCVLLKDIDFVDKFSDISCDDIRNKLYASKKTYDYVIISQAWDSYDKSVLNFASDSEGYEKWLPFLIRSIEHFSEIANKIIIIGAHPSVGGTHALQPTTTISKELFLKKLENVKVNNHSKMIQASKLFSSLEENGKVIVIEPYSIFCDKGCIVSDGKWSFFSDSEHISSASTDFVTERILKLLQGKS